MSTKSVVGNILLFATGLGAGYAVGYFITKKRMEKVIDSEIQSVKDAYAPFRKEGVYATPESAVEALIPEVEEESEAVDQVIDDQEYDLEDPNVVTKNLWRDYQNPEADEKPEDDGRQVSDEFDTTSQGEPQAEPMEDVVEELDIMPPRNPDKPYLVTVGQFMTDDIHPDDKISLLFFEGDDTLMDDRESVINNVEEMVGEANLHQFGIGSTDRNAVYIRNEKMQCDFEVIRDLRNYTEVILGIKPEKSGPLRMRNDDD